MERFKINAKGRGTGEPNWPKPPFALRKSVSKLVRDFLERTRDGTRQENEVDWLLVAIFSLTLLVTSCPIICVFYSQAYIH